MKTIYEQLNPDILASINNDEQRYPYTTRALKLKLRASDQWSQLTVSDIESIIMHSHVRLIDVKPIDFLFGAKFLTDGNDNNG
jgi:hypothetical protein